MLPRKWRPYPQAREFARSLKLAGYKDWTQFAASKERPHDIPSNPWRVYKNDFEGYGDFLDTGRHLFRPSASDTQRFSQSKQAQSLSKGHMSFLDLAREYASEYTLEPLPNHASASFLLARRESDLVTPCSVSYGREIDGVVVFHGSKNRRLTRYQIGFEIQSSKLYRFPSMTAKRRSSIAVREYTGSHTHYEVDTKDIGRVFDDHWGSQELYPRRSFLEKHACYAEDDILWMQSLLRVDERLFSLLKFDLSFTPDVFDVSNVLIAGVPVVYRKASFDVKGGYIIWIDTSVEGEHTPYYHDDRFSYVLCSVYERESNDVLGVYIFPKEVLIAKKILRNPDLQISGSRSLKIYPPWITPTERRGKEKQQWQNEHYYDLSSETAIEQSRIRFSNVFKRIQ